MDTVMMILFILGILSIIGTFLITPNDLLSTITVKILPFVSGVIMILVAITHFNWITIN